MNTVNIIKKLESNIGGRWTGITFHREDVNHKKVIARPMRFCEAIKESSTGPITLNKDLLSCPGALRSFGWSTNGDNQLAENMAKKNGTTKEIALGLIKNVPLFKESISAITIGGSESPDVIVSYSQPTAVMSLLYSWQMVKGIDFEVDLSSVMAVCGNVAAGAYQLDKVCLSFGCPESRQYGTIGRDRLIIGFPTHIIEDVFSKGIQPKLFVA